MLLDQPLQVIRLADFDYPSTDQAHRHEFLMLLWVTGGSSVQMVDYRRFALSPGEVLFIREGQVHRVVRPAAEGWLVLFHASLYRAFTRAYPAQELHGLFDPLNRQPVIRLDEQAEAIYGAILPLLEAIVLEKPGETVISAYLSILLYHANQLFRPLHPFLVHPDQAEQVRQLKLLIGQHFRTERNAPFYSAKLGMVTRKLNALALKLTGQRVHKLVNDRLLSEAEALLGGSGLSIKEITFELGFIDHAHFAAFFKKRRGMTASAFRKQATSPYT
ncbi:AraC family transcriptional regulator [Mucilaginibacter sp. BJC16-A38]|uniref:AraC family transcriptional regulator n=1 Tax=Mucilaginibacter phenanthrenivorans TaxID=1234842 RepID=UPI002157958E|nr:helix-turn-helix transcriptional regulator [Mucilaginibacter phenanthrenivorans]MCR8556954.1 AraC family transcriptional regulator [Mucilaginibacter phenanthrenivorans]